MSMRTLACSCRGLHNQSSRRCGCIPRRDRQDKRLGADLRWPCHRRGSLRFVVAGGPRPRVRRCRASTLQWESVSSRHRSSVRLSSSATASLPLNDNNNFDLKRAKSSCLNGSGSHICTSRRLGRRGKRVCSGDQTIRGFNASPGCGRRNWWIRRRV